MFVKLVFFFIMYYNFFLYFLLFSGFGSGLYLDNGFFLDKLMLYMFVLFGYNNLKCCFVFGFFFWFLLYKVKMKVGNIIFGLVGVLIVGLVLNFLVMLWL